MTKWSDAGAISALLTEGTVPATPSAGTQRIYIDSADHKLKRVNSSAAVTTIESAGGGGGALTQLVAPTPLVGTAATINLPSISGAYNALIGYWYARTTSGNAEDLMTVTFNGAVTAFDWIWAYASTSGALGTGATNTSAMTFSSIPGGADTANRFGGGWFLIPLYAGSVNHKSLTWQAHRAASGQSIAGAGAWRNTAAITSMLFTPAAGSFAIGSAIGLWGLT